MVTNNNKIKVMNKTEKRKFETKQVIEMLIQKYNAYNIEDGMGGRIGFFIDSKLDNTFYGEYHRSYQNITIAENMKLIGEGWTVDEINEANEANEYETLLNKEVECIITQYLNIEK
tara:strand:- start:394 stop:741 length:348 start_codon:yes stop_codon:yes gene_type:complete